MPAMQAMHTSYSDPDTATVTAAAGMCFFFGGLKYKEQHFRWGNGKDTGSCLLGLWELIRGRIKKKI